MHGSLTSERAFQAVLFICSGYPVVWHSVGSAQLEAHMRTGFTSTRFESFKRLEVFKTEPQPFLPTEITLTLELEMMF